MVGKDIVCIAMAYLLGGVCTGYYLVRLLAQTDIREQGSGGVGARNVGRMLGWRGFVITLLGDGLKGSAAILLARRFGISESAVCIAMVAVVAGHIWPVALRFKGGRGIATALGAYLAYDYRLALILLLLTMAFSAFRKGFILSGLGAFLLLPAFALLLKFSGLAVAALALLSAIILYAHRERLRRELCSEPIAQKEA